jgi:hypothetical protein
VFKADVRDWTVDSRDSIFVSRVVTSSEEPDCPLAPGVPIWPATFHWIAFSRFLRLHFLPAGTIRTAPLCLPFAL